MQEKKEESKLLGKIIDFFFSSNTRKYLFLIFLLGIVLRFIAVNNVTPIADEMVHGTHAINIINSGVISQQNQAPVWFYLTDLSYKLFGVNAFAGRFLSFLFGSLTILLVFLIAKELIDEKTALISAFLFSISAYSIRFALMEMDEAMIFFVLFSFYVFIKEWKAKKQISYLSVILIGTAIMIKAIAIPFLASFCIYILFSFKGKEGKEIFKKNKTRIIVSIIILLLISTPVLAYNYILYKQKGYTDLLFSRFLGINQEVFKGLPGFGENDNFSITRVLFEGVPWAVKAFLLRDSAIFLLGILGIIFIFYKKQADMRFFILFHLVPIVFLLGTQLLDTHFVSFMPLFAITSSYFISSISKTYLKNPKKLISVILIIILILNLYTLFPYLTSKSAVFKLRDFASSSISKNDIVIADSRIYRGRIAWMFNDKAYLEASLVNILDAAKNMSGQPVPTTIYFVECAFDDCGWGTVSNQQDFNQSMENLFAYFRNISSIEKIIYSGGEKSEPIGLSYFIVYKTTISIKPQVYYLIYNTHDWFYYPVRWNKPDWYDKYYPETSFQRLFNLAGKSFLWLEVIFAILSPIILFRYLFEKKTDILN